MAFFAVVLSPTNNTCILRFARFDANADADVDADADADARCRCRSLLPSRCRLPSRCLLCRDAAATAAVAVVVGAATAVLQLVRLRC